MCPSRNIPAHAGKTLPCSPSPDILSEHPRARGENQVRVDGHAVGHGTSPRTRGKRPIWCRPTEAGRNIPAHAGKTSGWCMGRGPRWGTSPRTRGKPHRMAQKGPELRNIPAHAGKRFTINYRLVNCAEHPRARGENAVPIRVVICHIGTSPRTRGKPRHLFRGGEITRNIPAHAGKTPRGSLAGWPPQEHPRARGENGTLTLKWCDEHRNIPAHAGKTRER